MKRRPLVSVVLPTHKRPDALKEALRSVSAQEGMGDAFDMEVIVVHDVPSDLPANIDAEFPCARCVQQSGRGPSAARNVGIRASRGDYVAFLDDDNLWLPHRLKVQIPVLESYGAPAVLYGQAFISGDAHADAWPETAPSGRVFEQFLELTDDFIPTDTLLIPRTAFDKAGLFDESLPTDEHYDLCLRLAFHFPFVFQRGPVVHGRFSKSGLWHTSIINGVFERTLPFVIEKALALLPPGPEQEEVRRRARVAVVSTIVLHQWEHHGFQRVRSYLLEALTSHPWMLEEKVILENLRRVANQIASRSDSPVEDLAVFYADIKRTVARDRKLSNLERGLATVLLGAATGLFSVRRYRAATEAFIRSLLHDPAGIARKDFWRLMGRATVRAPARLAARR